MLLGNALATATGTEPQDEDPDQRAAHAAVCLLRKDGDQELNDGVGDFHFIAGYQFALYLCCSVLSDPLRIEQQGVRRALKAAGETLAEWRRYEHKHAAELAGASR
jgi:hypothetical protein